MDTQQLAELQRDYDRFRERHGLPLAPVRQMGREEFTAMQRERTILYEAAIANHQEYQELTPAILVRFAADRAVYGPDSSRTTAEVGDAPSADTRGGTGGR